MPQGLDAETIDLPPSAFDAALCRWGLMLLQDFKAGLANIDRSLVEGGHFAAAVWASPEQDTLVATTMNTVMKGNVLTSLVRRECNEE